MMLHIRVPDKLAQQLDELAKATDRTKSYYVRRALTDFLEDYIDYQQGAEASREMKSKKEKTIPFEDIVAELDLDKDDFDA